MKKQMQRILAIVLVAVIGISVGVGAYFLLVTEAFEYKWENPPGAPAGIPQDRIIKIGVLDDMGYITGQGAKNGAEMAAELINERGGIQINNITYYIGVSTEDTEESNPALDLSRGVAAAERMIDYKKADFILGGFRTEALQAYREVVMLAKKIFMITGSATAKFCQDVYNNYNKYKYTFRIQPLNEVFLAGEVIRMLAFTILDQKVNHDRNITKIAIIRENLAWTARMSTSINGLIPVVSKLVYDDYTTLHKVEEIPYPQTASPIDFYGYWADIKASGAEITVPIISGPTGLYYSDVYGDTDQPSLSLGINVMGQQSIFWEQTGGNCEYEIAMTSFIRHAKTPFTLSFWDHYVGTYGVAPLYTATGAYDATLTLADAMYQAQSLDTDDIIAQLEESEFQLGAFIPRTAGGLYADLGSPTATWGVWTDGTYPRDVDTSTPEIDYSRHDVVEGSEPFGHAVFVQWVDDPLDGGKWECVPLGALPGIGTVYPPLASWEPEMYSYDIVTANISWPVR